jgi:hypothetical protein
MITFLPEKLIYRLSPSTEAQDHGSDILTYVNRSPSPALSDPRAQALLQIVALLPTQSSPSSSETTWPAG